MLKLSRRTEYALISLLHLGQLPPQAPVSSRELAERYHIPSPLLGKVLQALAHAGLALSVQGVHGGYRLARPLAEMRLGQVVAAVEGPPRMAPCRGEHRLCCDAHCHDVRQSVFRFQQDLLTMVLDVTLDHLAGLPGAPPPSP